MRAHRTAPEEDGQASGAGPGARRAAPGVPGWQEGTVFLAGALAFLLGSAVLFGWHVHDATLIQVRPEWTPMVYNTASCFVLGGIALLALATGRRRLAGLCGALVAAVGAVVGIEHAGGLDLGLDRLLMDPYITVASQVPGRMAPNTALCFSLAGLALITLSTARRRRWRAPLAGLLGAVVTAVAANGFLGYFTGIERAYAWGSLVPMAVHTAFGLVLLGLGVVARAWFEGTPRDERFPRWSPLLVGVAVAALTLGQWQAALAHARAGVPGRSILPSVVLGTGLSTALLMALAVHLAQRARHRERETRTVNAALGREVRQRELLEEARRQSEERLARVVESIAEGVFIVDGEGRIVFANAMAERLVGLTRDHITERAYDSPDWKLSTLDGRPFPAEELPVARVMRTRAPVHGVEFVLDRPDGSRIAMCVNAAPILDAAGAVTTVVATVSDVTRRKELERLKDTFVATVSHELRTPLASLRGFAELMLQREFPPEKRREFLGIIHDESIRLTDLINDFLDIQRMEAGKQLYEFRSVDLLPLCETTRALFCGDEGRRVLRLALPEDLPAVRADPDRIRQVLSNLVSNALKFSPAGSEVSLGARQEDGEVVVWVSDRGIGISADDLPRLFTKFFRADNLETRSIGGTGLGLAVVKEIVQAHGGRLWVESEPRQGSTFYFCLPQAERSAPPAPLPGSRPSGPADVMLVEDDQAYARLLCESLASEGLSVTVSPTGEQALDLLRGAPPRLAILDIHLSGRLDGWDVLTAMKGEPGLRAVPLLVLTAGETINGRGLALGGADYILKPVSCEWLQRTVQGQLSSSAGKRVLVVDDDAGFCRQVEECLATQGDIEVVSVVSGTEALERMAERMPDLLLLDLLMPGVDGFEVLRRLRLDKRAANLPVLVITGMDLSLEDKAHLKRRMATLARKQEQSLERIVDTVKQLLGAGRERDVQAA